MYYQGMCKEIMQKITHLCCCCFFFLARIASQDIFAILFYDV